jgi:hypothetical protein
VRRLTAVTAVAALALLGACSDDSDDDAAPSEETTTTATTAVPGTEEPGAPGEETTTTLSPTGFGTPEEAAEAFMATFFPDSTATLGEFQQGDNRSGEMEVLRPNEGGGTANVAATLLLRIDDFDNWQVFAAVNPFVTIEEPEAGIEVRRAPLTVSGVGRGFEANLNIRAMDLDGVEVAQAIGTGGSAAEPLPYAVELDLSEVSPVTPLLIVTSGGVGLEGDPGEFAAIRVITL